jgi:hypothetical protein
MIDRHWNGIALCSESDKRGVLGFVEGLHNTTCVIQRGAYGLRERGRLRTRLYAFAPQSSSFTLTSMREPFFMAQSIQETTRKLRKD